MEEVYAVGMRLFLEGGLGQQVKETTGLFETLRDVIKETQKSATDLSSAITKIGAASKGIASSWREIERAIKAASEAAARWPSHAGSPGGGGGGGSPAGGGGGSPSAPYRPNFTLPGYVPPVANIKGGGYGLPSIPTGGGAFAFPGSLVPAGGGGAGGGGGNGSGGIPLYPNGRGGPGAPFFGPNARFPTVGTSADYMRYAAELGIPAYGGYEALKAIYGPAAELDAVKANMLAQGFTPAQVDAAYALSVKTQRGTTGTSVTGNLELASKLMAVTQDAVSATNLMPAFAQLGVVLDATGHGGEGDALMAAIRSGEFRGVLTQKDASGNDTVNAGALVNFVHQLQAVSIASHGQLGPAQMYQFLKSGGISAAMLNGQSFFADMMAVQMAMGSARAGTGLQGFGMQFSAGKMSDAGHALLQQMGIFSKDPATWTKAGIGQILLKPGAMAPGVQQMERDNPAGFILNYLLPKMQAYLEKNYKKEYDSADDKHKIQMEAALMQTITSRIPGGVFGVEVIRNRLLIDRDRAAILKANDRDAYGIEVGNNPLVQQKAFTAAYEAMLIALGATAMKPAIEAMQAITRVLNGISDWATKNPDEARRAIEGFATGVAMFAAGTLAASALAILTGPGGVAALATGIEMLGKEFGSIPKWVIDGSVGAAIGARIGGVPGAAIGLGAGALVGDARQDHTLPDGSKAGPLGVLGGILNGTRDPWTGLLKQPAGGAQPGSSTNNPLHITGPVAVTNGRHFARGVGSALADQSSRASPGTTGPDPRSTGPYQGLMGAY